MQCQSGLLVLYEVVHHLFQTQIATYNAEMLLWLHRCSVELLLLLLLYVAAFISTEVVMTTGIVNAVMTHTTRAKGFFLGKWLVSLNLATQAGKEPF